MKNTLQQRSIDDFSVGDTVVFGAPIKGSGITMKDPGDKVRVPVSGGELDIKISDIPQTMYPRAVVLADLKAMSCQSVDALSTLLKGSGLDSNFYLVRGTVHEILKNS